MLGPSAMHPIIRFHLQGLDQNSMHATREIDLGCRTSSRFFSLPAPNRWNFNKGKLLDPCSPISLRLILTGTKLPNPAMPSKLSLLFFGWSAVISYICLCSENSTAQPNTPNTQIYIYKYHIHIFLNPYHIHRLGESQAKHRTTNSTRHMASKKHRLGASGGGGAGKCVGKEIPALKAAMWTKRQISRKPKCHGICHICIHVTLRGSLSLKSRCQDDVCVGRPWQYRQPSASNIVSCVLCVLLLFFRSPWIVLCSCCSLCLTPFMFFQSKT